MEDLIPSVSLGAAATIATAAGLAYYCLTSQEEPAHTVVPVDDQSVAVDGNPHIRASKLVPPGTFVEYMYEDTKTLYESFQRGLRQSKNGPCLGYRPGGKGAYEWISYKEMFERASYIGSALIRKGVKADNSTCVGVFSRNRPEWIITEVGLYSYSMVVVPIYDTLGKEACSHIIYQAEISAVICDRNEQALILVRLAESTPVLKYIIIMDQASDELLAECKKARIELCQFDDMLKLGKEHLVPVKPSKPDDIATICYTSGTTGTPKGVMLTHKNVIAAVSATKMQITVEVGPKQDDCMISFLPLSHMLVSGTEYFKCSEYSY
ncbi:hypothetical protein RvY_17807-2 [Ramazzottius varieornatus]|uniref:long-chain-fatty-acid--CoA ligase n=1 Tax=Ramazzottius varieornatus TaxID=947166 RepID=A0A1D1W3G9_RAMVA|nr:hypothetical protein RvY_17807-2 [Ramazzottius varieornatus]